MESSICPMNSDVKANALLLQQLIAGFGFRPTAEELINYLKSEEPGRRESFCIIPLLQDICKINPWDLPDEFNEKSIIPSNGQECWFICPQTQSKRISRKTPCGSSWKIDGQPKPVKAGNGGEKIGSKKVLVFPSDAPTTWVIHEYHLLDSEWNGKYVLCHVMRRRDEGADNSTIESEHGANCLADLELHRPDYEESSSELLQFAGQSQNSLPTNINQFMNTESPSFMDFSLENRLHPESQADFLQLLQFAGQSQNSLPTNINQFMNTESPSFMDFSLENRLYPESQVSSDVFQPARQSQNSLPSNINQFMNTESPSFMDFSLENRLQPENRVSSDMLHLFQPAQRSRSSLLSNIHQFTTTESQSFMDFSLKNGITNKSIQLELLSGESEEDEDFVNMLNEALFGMVGDVEVPIGDSFNDDFFDADQMQTGNKIQARTDSLIENSECPVLKENQRKRKIDSLHCAVPLEEKKGLGESKFSGSFFDPEKPMPPPVCAAGVKYYGKDDVPRFKKVRQETAAKSIKQQYIFFDETAARAKGCQISIMENRQARMIGSLHDVFLLEQKKGVIQSKASSSHASSTKPMESRIPQVS